MLGDALSYPKSGDEWVKRILIGGTLTLIGAFIFITLLPVQGYLVRVLRSAAADEQVAPNFEEWGDLFVDGIKLILVQIVYLLVPIVVLVGGAFVTGIGVFAAGDAPGLGTGVGLFGAVILLVGVLLGLVAIYLVPAALTNFAHEDSFGAAFDIATITDAAFTSEYVVALVLAFFVSFVLGIVAVLLSFILVGFFIQFYVQVAVFYLFGRGYARGLGLEPGSQTGTEAATSV